MIETTLVIAKPDAYERGLVGAVISRFETARMRLTQVRVSVGEDHITEEHYPRDDQWLRVVGQKTLDDHAELGISVRDRFGTDDAAELGSIIRGWLVTFLQSGPVVPMLFTGNRSIQSVRKMVGNTLPVLSAPGTIRGDYSTDSTDLAAHEGRPVHNLVHASGDPNEAEREASLWFPGLSHRD